MSAWQPIETAPPYKVPVLLIAQYPTGRGWTDIYHGWRNAGGANWDRWPHNFRPTHWMPVITPSSEERRSIPSEASSSSQTRDDLNYTQPSDATELVDRLRRLGNKYISSGPNDIKWLLLEAAEALTQAQSEKAEALKTVEVLAWLGEKVDGCIDPSGVLDVRGLKQALREAQARATAAEGDLPSREEIARVIAPKAYEFRDRPFEYGTWNCEDWAEALAKADAILALRKPSSAQQGPAE